MGEDAQEFKMVEVAYRTRPVSPVVVRTRFNDQFVHIKDLQMQLYRDISRCETPEVREYIQELIDRLERLRR